MKQLDLRKRVADFLALHPNETKSFVVNHFVSQGESKSTIYNIISILKKRGSIDRKSGSGGINIKLNNHQREAISRWMVNKKGISIRQQAKKYGVNKITVRNILK